MTHCTICGKLILGSDHANEAWCAACFKVNLAFPREPGQRLGRRDDAARQEPLGRWWIHKRFLR